MSDVNRRFFEALMAEKKLSLRALAARMEMNHSQLSLTFSGGRRMTLDEASQLSQIFSVPLHRVVEAAGVSVKPYGGKRVPVIGAMQGDGTVEMYGKKVVERTTAPEDIPADSIGIQCRTSGTPLEYMDGWVFFARESKGGDYAFMGRVCLCQITGGPAVIALVKRGYQEGTSNLSGPYRQDSARLDWATPVILTRN